MSRLVDFVLNMSRRSVRIAALYGTEWSNLPSMRTQRLARREEKRLNTIVTFSIPSREVFSVTFRELEEDERTLLKIDGKFRSNARFQERCMILLEIYEYLVEHPGIMFLERNTPFRTQTMVVIDDLIPKVERQLAKNEKWQILKNAMVSLLSMIEPGTHTYSYN